jgi:hypothetical protein
MSGGGAGGGVFTMPGFALVPRDTTLFASALGEHQGRIERVDGRAIFVLGASTPSLRGRLAVGDWVEVAQELDCTGIHLVRLAGTVRVPDESPPGATWVLSIRLPFERLTEWTLRPGTRRLDDLAANVSRLVGVHRIAVRLALEAA